MKSDVTQITAVIDHCGADMGESVIAKATDDLRAGQQCFVIQMPDESTGGIVFHAMPIPAHLIGEPAEPKSWRERPPML